MTRRAFDDDAAFVAGDGAHDCLFTFRFAAGRLGFFAATALAILDGSTEDIAASASRATPTAYEWAQLYSSSASYLRWTRNARDSPVTRPASRRSSGSWLPSSVLTPSSCQRETGRIAVMSRRAWQVPVRRSTSFAIRRRASGLSRTSRPQLSPFFQPWPCM